jgi:hypothetical protein
VIVYTPDDNSLCNEMQHRKGDVSDVIACTGTRIPSVQALWRELKNLTAAAPIGRKGLSIVAACAGGGVSSRRSRPGTSLRTRGDS